MEKLLDSAFAVLLLSAVHQQTVFVVAAGCTDGVYKRLIIGHGIAGGEADFVHALEYQMLVIAFKVGRDLLPQLFKCCDLEVSFSQSSSW